MHGRRHDSRPRIFLVIFLCLAVFFWASIIFDRAHKHGHPKKIKLDPPEPLHFSCTLVTQTSADRIGTLNALLERWTGRIVLAVLFRQNTTRDTITRTSSHFPSRVKVLNVVHKGGEYPINILRNMAIKLVNTTHYLLIDADMVPSVGLEQLILHDAMTKWLSDPKMALVVPAFEAVDQSPCPLSPTGCLAQIPATFQHLQACVEEHRCQVFQQASNIEAQSTTDSSQWLKSDLTQRTVPLLCFLSALYEPFVVLPKLPNTPLYYDRFVGYGKNRLQHITHLRFAGFNFRVMSEGFLFHQVYPETEARISWRNPDSGLNKRMTQLYQEFKSGIERKYLAPNIPLCANNVREPKEDGDE